MIHPSKLIRLSTGSFAALSIAFFLFLFSCTPVADAECLPCPGEPEKQNECPPSQIGSCLILRCVIQAGGWYLTSPANNVTIATSDKDNRLDNFNVFGETGPNGEALWVLNITKSTNQNFGTNRILHSSSFGGKWCSFNLFVYADAESTNGNFTLNGLTKRVKTNDVFVVPIDSFSSTIFYSYQLDSSPLDNLKVNGTIVPSTDCTQQGASLRCLRTENIEFHTERCVTDYTLDLSYDYAEYFPYSSQEPYIPGIFTQRISLQYPPKVRYSIVDVPYRSLESEVVLRCEVECGNPNTYTYIWRRADNSVIEQTISDSISYTIRATSVNDIFEVTCTASNIISSTTNAAESRTRFVMKYLDINAEKSGSSLPVWAIVLIALGGFLLLVLVVLLIVLVFLKRNKDEKPPKNANQDLTPNPVYGNTTLANINTRGGGQAASRSDKVYTVEEGLNPNQNNNTRYDSNYKSSTNTSSKTKV